jgi:hypothetical protein
LPEEVWSKGKVDASDMDAVDVLIGVVREKANRA